MTDVGRGTRLPWRTVDGIVLLDKPVGLTSNAALQTVRRLYRARKAGHTGSLDPFATGVLPLCFGEATKVSGHLLEADKRYVATLELGARTSTADCEGPIIETQPVPALTPDAVRAVLATFLGEQSQVPPMHSALKRDGRPLYELARAGIEVDRPARRVRILALDLVELTPSRLVFDVRCSKGTYVRTLGEDLARAIGTVGHLSALRRLDVGGVFTGLPVHRLDELEALAGDTAALDALLLPPDRALVDRPRVVLDAMATVRFTQGQTVAVATGPGSVRVYGPGDVFLGIGAGAIDGASVAPVRLLATES
jgi:tRNA pseudouridine55 synthase